MDLAIVDLQPGQHIPGEVTHSYLEAHVNYFDILDHVRLNTKVVSATHRPEGGWIFRAHRLLDLGEDEPMEAEIFAKQLMVASGLISSPFTPHTKGQEIFRRPLSHTKDFAANAETISTKR